MHLSHHQGTDWGGTGLPVQNQAQNVLYLMASRLVQVVVVVVVVVRHRSSVVEAFRCR